MDNQKVFQMEFGKVYKALVNKAKRKGRTKDEVDAIITWLTGYSPEETAQMAGNQTCYGTFFEKANLNPARKLIKGTICKVRVEKIADPFLQEVRYLDKLVDELAQGKPMNKILRKEYTNWNQAD